MKNTVILGNSKEFQEVLAKVSKLALIKRPVLITGERGTGKELIAERLHYLSSRWDQVFLKTNCGSLSESLLESELFGHEAGSFTGAVKLRKGRFELANNGSLFLDEIGNAPSRLQETILRVIEYGEFERIGGQQTLTSDVRLIAATNEDLLSKAETTTFRADLLDRLSFDVISLPPLRARSGDILELAEYYGISMAKELGWPVFNGFTKAIEKKLNKHQWPGNVRELKNVIERSVFYWEKPQSPIAEIIINPFESPYRLTHPRKAPGSLIELYQQSKGLKPFIEQSEKLIIQHALQTSNYNQVKAADSLNISYHSLRAYLRRLHIT